MNNWLAPLLRARLAIGNIVLWLILDAHIESRMTRSSLHSRFRFDALQDDVHSVEQARFFRK